MTAWTEQQPNLRWFHVKTGDASYPFMKDDLTLKHNGAKNGTVISVLTNVAGTEAVIKVAGCGTWKPLLQTPIINVYTPATLPKLQAMVASTAWRTPAK